MRKSGAGGWARRVVICRGTAAFLLVHAVASCGGTTSTGQQSATHDDASAGSGGVAGGASGGRSSSGGHVNASGGVSASGGVNANGGVSANGGANASGGVSASGGASPIRDAGPPRLDASALCEMHGPECCVPGLESVKAEVDCTIDVLANYVSPVYKYEDLVQKVAALPKDLLVSVSTTADVAWAAADSPPAARMELHLKAASASKAAVLLEARRYFPFRLSCNGTELFIGTTYDLIGAAALRTPVMHVEETAGGVVLRLGAWQGAWMSLGGGDEAARKRLDRLELRGALCQRGLLREFPSDTSGDQ